MSFLSPLYLVGIAGVVVPVLIHLFGRRRPRHLRFPSLMLLHAAQQRRTSPLRIRRLISLLMRMAALVLLAMALAGPLARSRTLARVAPGGRMFAIILDASVSMSARGDSTSAFERARTAAREIISALPPGSRVLFGTAGARLEPLAGGEPMNNAAALDALAALRPTGQRTSIGETVADALQLFGDADVPGTIFVLTDMQASGFAEPAHLSDEPGAEVVIVDVGAEVAANAAVTDAQVGWPSLRNRPLTISARVEAWGETTGERVPLTLEGAGRSVSVGVTPLAGTSALTELDTTVVQPGVFAGKVSLPPDEVTFDDTRHVAALVRPYLRALIVGDETRTRYLRAALDPYGDDERTVISVELVAADGLADADLSRYDVVALCDLPLLSTANVDALAGEMRRGMGVMLFVGPQAIADEYAAKILPALGLRGVQPGAPVSWSEGVALVVVEDQPGPLASFLDPAEGDLGVARFRSARELSVPDELRRGIRARYEDGNVAVVEGSVGRGRVMLMNMAADDAWANLVREPVYVPLMHRAVYHLAAGREPTVNPAAPGEVVAGSAQNMSGALSVARVGGGEEPLARSGDAWSFVPETTGVYRVAVGGKDLAVLAVNIDSRESEIARVTAVEAREYLRPLRTTVVVGQAAGDFAGRVAAPQVDISSLLALLVLLTLAVEAVYSLEATDNSSR